MKLNRFWMVLAAVLLATSAFAQVTSNLTGRVTTDGTALPGVTVTISSPQMQGTRTAVTDVNGIYNFASIPPGNYTVKFEMESMQTVTRPAHVGLGQTGRADAELKLTAVAESITVTASAPAVLETQEIQTNVTKQLTDELPITRTFESQALLAPNVTQNSTAFNDQLFISGAPAHESVYMVNGAVINENLRSEIHNLFIEDAIQETTVLTGAIAAEYGRFTGGVVSSITKSGGNEFSGSLRDTLTNNNWTAKTPNQTTTLDKINPFYEGTFGGRIVRDRLWFFAAGRYAKRDTQSFLQGANNAPFDAGDKNTRYEIKLTGQITPKHSLVGSYLDIKNPQTNICFLACYEYSNIDAARELPNNFKTLHYSGIFTNNLLGELNWSKKYFAFQDSGGPSGDFAHATWGVDLNNFAFFGAPVFCGNCGPEQRNNKYWDGKLTYYLASKVAGTHNITGGYQDWAEQHISNNYQSGSNFGVYVFSEQTPVSGPNDVFKPIIKRGDLIEWAPIFALTQGSKFTTRSAYVNDKWDLNSHWSFNLGARYDKNHGVDASGTTRANDSIFEPRLGATYDLMGNGRLRFNASFAKYAAKIAENVGNIAAAGGNPAQIYYRYTGPTISGLPTVDAFQQLYNWFQANGGTNMKPLFGSIPGVNTQIAGSLRSPDVNEFTVGAGTQIGRGFVRLDLMNRSWGNFYNTRTDASTGQVTDQLGNTLDLNQIITSSEGLSRKYRAATIQAQYPFTTHFQVGGNFTYATLKGNVTAETPGSGPVAENNLQYPEYINFAQNNPVGYLLADERNKIRLWATYTLPTRIGDFIFSGLERYDSGTPYSIIIPMDSSVVANYLPEAVVNQYAGAPTSVNYYVGGQRGNLRWDNVNALDLSVDYRLRVGRAELFVQPQVTNVFNKASVINGNTTVTALAPFNPFKETPVEGVNYKLSSDFGKPQTPTDYALMRTYRVSFGVRF